MKNSLRIHKWTHNEFNIFILGVLTHPLSYLFPSRETVGLLRLSDHDSHTVLVVLGERLYA